MFGGELRGSVRGKYLVRRITEVEPVKYFALFGANVVNCETKTVIILMHRQSTKGNM